MENQVLTWYLKIIGVQNQLTLIRLGTALIHIKISKVRNPTSHTNSKWFLTFNTLLHNKIENLKNDNTSNHPPKKITYLRNKNTLQQPKNTWSLEDFCVLVAIGWSEAITLSAEVVLSAVVLTAVELSAAETKQVSATFRDLSSSLT